MDRCLWHSFLEASPPVEGHIIGPFSTVFSKFFCKLNLSAPRIYLPHFPITPFPFPLSLPLTWGGSVAEWLSCSRARVQIAAATLSGSSFRQTVHTHRASVHQAAKLVATLLRVVRVTAGLAESIGSPTTGLMTHITFRLTAKNRDQLRNPTLGSRVWATLTFYSLPSPRLPKIPAMESPAAVSGPGPS